MRMATLSRKQKIQARSLEVASAARRMRVTGNSFAADSDEHFPRRRDECWNGGDIAHENNKTAAAGCRTSGSAGGRVPTPVERSVGKSRRKQQRSQPPSQSSCSQTRIVRREALHKRSSGARAEYPKARVVTNALCARGTARAIDCTA